jgi:hypothetical protein
LLRRDLGWRTSASSSPFLYEKHDEQGCQLQSSGCSKRKRKRKDEPASAGSEETEIDLEDGLEEAHVCSLVKTTTQIEGAISIW